MYPQMKFETPILTWLMWLVQEAIGELLSGLLGLKEGLSYYSSVLKQQGLNA